MGRDISAKEGVGLFSSTRRIHGMAVAYKQIEGLIESRDTVL